MRFASPLWGQALLWTLLGAVFAVTIVAVVRAGRRRISRRAWHEQWLQHRRSLGTGPRLHALDMRYTRGEIGRDDYQQRRAALLSPEPQSSPSSAPRSRRVASG